MDNVLDAMKQLAAWESRGEDRWSNIRWSRHLGGIQIKMKDGGYEIAIVVDEDSFQLAAFDVLKFHIDEMANKLSAATTPERTPAQ